MPVGVVTEVETQEELRKLPWWQQGSLALHTPRTLEYRNQTRFDVGVVAALDAFWEAAIAEEETSTSGAANASSSGGGGALSQSTYCVIFERVSLEISR